MLWILRGYRAVSYSDKVQEVFAPTGDRGWSPPTARFVLLEKLPIEVTAKGEDFRIQAENESVSKGWRLFAVDLASEKAGRYRAWLLHTTGSLEAMETQMHSTGLPGNAKQGGFAIFKQLVREGRAKELELQVPPAKEPPYDRAPPPISNAFRRLE